MARIDSKYYVNGQDFSDVPFGNHPGNVKDHGGCAISCLATYMLSRSGLSTVTRANKVAALTALNSSGLFTNPDNRALRWAPQNYNISFNNSTIKVAYNQTTDVAAEVAQGKIGMLRFTGYNANNVFCSHFVLVDGLDNASQAAPDDPDNFKKHLCVDPSGGVSRTLHAAIKHLLGASVTPNLSHIDSQWRTVFVP